MRGIGMAPDTPARDLFISDCSHILDAQVAFIECFGGTRRQAHRQFFVSCPLHPSGSYTYLVLRSLVYDPKSDKNEEDSEIVFREFAKEVDLTQLDTDSVSAYIIATKQHDVSGSDDEDLRAFIDLDMAVVGRERDGYLQYASQVR